VQESLVTAGGAVHRTSLLLVYAVVLLGVVAHGLGWALLRRRRGVGWVWTYWNALGGILVVGGLGAIVCGWLVLGLASVAGGALAGVGLLLLSVGLWMLVPV
jgi:hypothetical protein